MNQRGEDGLLSRWLEARGEEARKERAEDLARETLEVHALKTTEAWTPQLGDRVQVSVDEKGVISAHLYREGDEKLAHPLSPSREYLDAYCTEG